MSESLPEWFSVMKWWWDLQPCCLLFCYCLRSRCAFMGQLVRILLQITPNNKSGSVCFSWAGQQRLTVRRENESQTFNCVSGGKFQDFGYLMKILSLGSFPMWCQNGRRVNVWTVYWRPTLNAAWVCVCLRLGFQRDCFHIEATLTSTSRCRLRPIQVQVPENKQWHRLYSLVACCCLAESEAWAEESEDRR